MKKVPETRIDEEGAAASAADDKSRRRRRSSKEKAVKELRCDCWKVAAAVTPHANRVLLWGAPGTGKTWWATHGALEPNRQVFSITLTDDSPAAEIRGHFVPAGDRFVWLDGPGLAAWRAGGRLVLNELANAGPDMLSFLLVLLDDPGSARVTLPSGETVQPSPGFQVIATMNGHPDALPEPLRDRFPTTIEVDSVHPGALARLDADVRAAAGATALLPQERRISVRTWLEFNYLRAHIDPEIAAFATFGKRATDLLDALSVARQAEGIR